MKSQSTLFACFIASLALGLMGLKTEQAAVEGSEALYIGYQELYVVAEQGKTITKHGVEACQHWSLATTDLAGVLEAMEHVSGTVWYSRCYQLGCYYSFTVANAAGARYQMDVYAGSYVILSNDDETLHFIDKEPNRLFLEACSCCEE